MFHKNKDDCEGKEDAGPRLASAQTGEGTSSHFHKRKGDADGPRDVWRKGRHRNAVVDLLRTEHQGSGANPHEKDDEVDKHAQDQVEVAVDLDEVGPPVPPGAMAGYEEGEDRGYDWFKVMLACLESV